MRSSSKLAAALLAVAALAAAAQGKPPRPSYRLPRGWQLKTDDKNGTYFSNGESSILLRRADARRAAKLAPELYGGKASPSGASIEVSTFSVSGAPAKRLIRRYERSHGGERRGVESVYEEIILIPALKKGATWTIDYQAPLGSFETAPSDLGDWKAFLKSFKPS